MMKGYTKNKPAAISDLVRRWVNTNIETIDVAEVVGNSNYASSRLVDVQPLAVVREKDGVEIEVPTVLNCPVILQGNVDGFISFPMNVGTKVLVGYPKHSIEEFVYASEANTYTPVDGLTFGSAQAVVLGYAAQANGVDYSLSLDDFEIRFKGCRLSFKADETISLTNPNFNFDVSPDGSLGVSNGSVTVILNVDGTWSITGGEGTVNGATVTAGGNLITAAGTDLDQLKEDFDALHAAYVIHGTGSPAHPPPDPL